MEYLNLSAPGRLSPALLLLLLLISLSFHVKKKIEMIIHRKVNHISLSLQRNSHSLGDNLAKEKTKKNENEKNGYEEKIYPFFSTTK